MRMDKFLSRGCGGGGGGERTMEDDSDLNVWLHPEISKVLMTTTIQGRTGNKKSSFFITSVEETGEKRAVRNKKKRKKRGRDRGGLPNYRDK